MAYVPTQHAEWALREREIPVEWMERVLASPEAVVPDPRDAILVGLYGRVPEFGGRFLRVVVVQSIEPVRVVSVFFDRTMKGEV